MTKNIYITSAVLLLGGAAACDYGHYWVGGTAMMMGFMGFVVGPMMADLITHE